MRVAVNGSIHAGSSGQETAEEGTLGQYLKRMNITIPITCTLSGKEEVVASIREETV